MLTFSWMRDFMDCQGQVVLANYLNKQNTRTGRGAVDYEMESKLLGCLKKSMSVKVSPINALADSSSVQMMPCKNPKSPLALPVPSSRPTSPTAKSPPRCSSSLPILTKPSSQRSVKV